MNVQNIVKQLVDNKIIQSAPNYCEKLSGGTVSELYLLDDGNQKYVIKQNDPKITKYEAEFLTYYEDTNFIPKLFFVEDSNRYIVYSYVDGTTRYVGNKRKMLHTLVLNLLNHYKPYSHIKGWGWADDPSQSWESFIIGEIKAASKILQSHLDSSYLELVLNLAEKNKNRKPFLLHGDCGIHNFLFKEGQMSGVIDPSPVIGEPMYDLIYAFCSSPDDLTKETYASAANLLRFNGDQTPAVFYEEVLIGLYLRLATCIKHHRNDWDNYLQAWSYWVDIVKSGK